MRVGARRCCALRSDRVAERCGACDGDLHRRLRSGAVSPGLNHLRGFACVLSRMGLGSAQVGFFVTKDTSLETRGCTGNNVLIIPLALHLNNIKAIQIRWGMKLWFDQND